MKTLRLPAPLFAMLVLAACLLFALAVNAHLNAQPAERPKSPTLDIIAPTSLTTAMTITQYGKVSLSDWLTVTGKEPKGKQSVTMWDPETFSHEHVKITTKHEPVVTKNADGTWEISFNPPAPKPAVTKAPEKDFDTLLASTTSQIRDMRVREYRGAMFETLAVNYIRGERVVLAHQVRAAREAAKQLADKEDEFTRAAVLEAAEEFAVVVENAQPRVQR